MFKVISDNDNTILVKVRKDGVEVEQARTIKTLDGKLLLFPSNKLNSLTFKSLSDIKLKLVAGQYIAKIANDVQIYIKPHYQEFHRVLMTENYNRMSLANVKYRQNLAVDNMELDDKAILDNMLEYVGTI